jgi:prepilin-type N-terminal cleavage/methylation domain-containing protein
MLKIKRKLSQEGFSLIELMVAIVILALAIFGIFQAYSTGFMGMADARDRTVAVNYIQKTLEDYKNTPFKKIKDKSMSIIPGTKFFTASTIIDMGETEGDTHLKKVITQVRWPDRNGNIKIEENSMLIYEAPKTGDILAPSDIIIYASTYYRILPYTSTELTAEIHDKNGNIVSNWKGNIIFTITSSSPIGGLTPSHETTVTKGTSNGSASLTYYSYTEEKLKVLY